MKLSPVCKNVYVSCYHKNVVLLIFGKHIQRVHLFEQGSPRIMRLTSFCDHLLLQLLEYLIYEPKVIYPSSGYVTV